MIAIAVDDEVLMLGALVKAVNASPDIREVTQFSDCEQALDFVRENVVDIAFLDINMRGMGGLALAEQIITVRPDCKVVFCTGYEEYAISAFKLHASGYLMKPISAADVQTEIDNIKGVRQREKLLTVKCFGNFEVYAKNEKLQFKEVTGLGINGSCYSVTSEYGLRTEPLPNRYRSIPKTADIIFILLGTNDFNMNTPLGTIADTADLSFYGGMNYTFDRFAEEYPDATVILITPIRRHGVLWQNSQGLKLTDYNDAIKAAADKHGYILMDLYELTYEKITPGVLADAVHPNKYGHQIMAEAIITWLQENMETVLK